MDELTDPAGIAALAAAGLALLSLLISLIALRRTRIMRKAQTVVLGEDGSRDLVAHGSDLDRELRAVAERLDASVAALEAHDERLEKRVDGAVAHYAVVRYDAMGEMTGRQSSSVALLDAHRSGVVFSAILNRDSARLYAKQVVRGESEFHLTPEEQEALAAALTDRADG